MTACTDREILLHALLDGELDAVNSVAMESHLRGCRGCADEYRRLRAIRESVQQDGTRHAAPPGLRERIERQIAAENGEPARPAPVRSARSQGTGWLAGGALGAIAASLALLLGVPQFTSSGIEDQLVASHVRSLLVGHVVDVATSNHHVVKPWFNGKTDFAPPVIELADRGFPLVGGRLDVLDDRVVPAIVYRRRLHTINLFVRPVGGLTPRPGIGTRREGYSLVRWTQGGLEFWAVSDIDLAELQSFHQAFAARAGG